MKQQRITDPIRAQAAIAFLISEGWGIDLPAIKATLPGGITENDWLEIANACLDWTMNELAKGKVIPISRFKR